MEIMEVEKEQALSQSLVYLVSSRGGNNYWARLINGCDKIESPGFGTLGVSIADNGRFTLLWDPIFFEKRSPRMRKLILVHEAGHIALRHHERLFRILSTITDQDTRTAVLATFGTAADLADNDAVVRHEPEFKDAVAAGEWDGLLPETFNLPKGKSFEEYVIMIAKKAKPIAAAFNQMIKAQEAKEGQGQGKGGQKSEKGGKPGAGSGKGTEQGEAGGDGSGGESDGSGSAEGAGGGKGSEKQQGPADFNDDPDGGVPDELQETAKKHPGLLEQIMKDFNRLTNSNHKGWVEKAKNATAQEGVSLANKMKQHARQLAKSAWEQTVKSRGFVPGHIQGIIKKLLMEERIPWHWFLQDAIQEQICSKIVESMGSPNLSLLNEDTMEPWPGSELDHVFNVVWITDTSGSMGDVEVSRGFAVMNSLMAQNKSIRCRHIQVDANIQHEEETDNLQIPDETKDQERYGYGGTVYLPAFKRILGCDEPQDWSPNAEHCDEPVPKADLVVVLTDGYVGIDGECFPQFHPGCPIIWLVTPAHAKPLPPGINHVPPDHVIQMFPIGGAAEEED